jgi:transcriptional regulator with XRE-family HTH domain
VRQHLRLTQTEFAEQIGISRERIASYEDARAPVTLKLALAICRQFLVGEKWLAKGFTFGRAAVPFRTFNARLYLDLMSDFDLSKELAGLPFASAFDRHLSSKYEALVEQDITVPRFQLTEDDDLTTFRNYLHSLADLWCDRIRPGRQRRFFASLVRSSLVAGLNLSAQLSDGLSPFEKVLVAMEQDPWLEIKSTFLLPQSSLKSRTSGVNILTLDELLAVLRSKTSRKGGMARLAKDIHVQQARVSEWLSGKKVPGGETTFRLLQWVEQQERQQNTLGSAINTAKGKTQVRSSTVYEKTKPSPQKQ